MRKVMASKWVYGKDVGGPGVNVARQQVGLATFHAFGTDYEELPQGVGNFPCAIVEWPDGKIESFPIQLVHFIDPEVPSA